MCGIIFALALLIAGAANSWAAPKTRSVPAADSATPGTRKIAGATYLNARAWAGSIGLTATWVEPNRRLKLANAFVTLVLEAERRELTINDLRVFVGEPVMAADGTLWISVIDARLLLGAIVRASGIEVAPPDARVICLDAGHGGTDTGTQNKKLGLEEKRLTLDVTQRVKKILEARGHAVVMTRNDDRFVDLADRAQIANRAGADLFVSIHFNAFPQPHINGTETYVLTRRSQRSTSAVKRERSDNDPLPGNAMDPWNAILGYSVHRHLLGSLRTFDRGLKFARFKVLTLVNCPGVLIESGYLSHDAEARKIATDAYRNTIAEAIAEGINAYTVQVTTWKKK